MGCAHDTESRNIADLAPTIRFADDRGRDRRDGHTAHQGA